MAADVTGDATPEEMARKASEYDDFTIVYVRRNRSGRWVRDAKFYPDAGTADVAARLFADDMAGADVRPCATLRGQVRTVDDFEYADDPDVFTNPYAAMLDDYQTSSEDRWPFTVYACWDTGDGPRRYSKQVQAVDARHAELLARLDKTAGEFLAAAVVEGHVPVEDADAVWATLDGEPETGTEPTRRRWRLWVLAAAVSLAVVVLVALVIA
jgi:hypothetical protein